MNAYLLLTTTFYDRSIFYPVYRATFPLSFKEIKNINKGDGWKVLFGVVVGVAVGVFLSEFLSNTS